MYKHRIIYSLASVALFVFAVIAVSNHGTKNRVYASGKTVHVVDSPQKAYDIWKEKKVRGRTLLLFDTYPHNMGFYSYNFAPQLNQTNLIEFSIFQNIIRRVYLIVPEAEWGEFRKQKFVRPIREATNVTKGLYLYNQSGIPITAVTSSSLPHTDEEVLVYINSHIFNSGQAQALLAQKAISADIIISYESHAK